jgi:hypothetical protein
MFPMTVSLTISNAAQLQALAAIVAGDAAQLPTPKKQEKKAEPVKVEAAQVTVVPAPPDAGGAVGTPGGSTPTITGGKTLDDAKALTMKVVAAKGRDTAVELLAKFGVKVAAKLEAGQVDAFCAEAEAVLNG